MPAAPPGWLTIAPAPRPASAGTIWARHLELQAAHAMPAHPPACQRAARPAGGMQGSHAPKHGGPWALDTPGGPALPGAGSAARGCAPASTARRSAGLRAWPGAAPRTRPVTAAAAQEVSAARACQLQQGRARQRWAVAVQLQQAAPPQPPATCWPARTSCACGTPCIASHQLVEGAHPQGWLSGPKPGWMHPCLLLAAWQVGAHAHGGLPPRVSVMRSPVAHAMLCAGLIPGPGDVRTLLPVGQHAQHDRARWWPARRAVQVQTGAGGCWVQRGVQADLQQRPRCHLAQHARVGWGHQRLTRHPWGCQAHQAAGASAPTAALQA